MLGSFGRVLAIFLFTLLSSACSISDGTNVKNETSEANTPKIGIVESTVLPTPTKVISSPTPIIAVATATQSPVATLVVVSTTPPFHGLFDCANVSEIPSSECEALEVLYQSTDGNAWSDYDNWLNTNTPCTWMGITCADGHVVELSLFQDELIGIIPAELSQLTKLEKLGIGGNELGGAIPPELSQLSNLEWLTLSGLELSGVIPSELSQLNNLKWLKLNGKLGGTIPSELSQLSNLEILDLSGNELSGAIPAELSQLTKLEELDLSRNELNCTIPPE